VRRSAVALERILLEVDAVSQRGEAGDIEELTEDDIESLFK
jgi:hypothetical protein